LKRKGIKKNWVGRTLGLYRNRLVLEKHGPIILKKKRKEKSVRWFTFKAHFELILRRKLKKEA
jgi:hypothetical protein